MQMAELGFGGRFFFLFFFYIYFKMNMQTHGLCRLFTYFQIFLVCK